MNFADLLQRAGLYGQVPDMPYAPGFEVAGEVARVGQGVDRLVGGGPGRGPPPLRGLRPGRDPAGGPGLPLPGRAFLSPRPPASRWSSSRPGFAFSRRGTPAPVTPSWSWAPEAEWARPQFSWRWTGAFGSSAPQAHREKRAFVVDELGAEACFDSRGAWADDLFEALGEKRGLDIALDPVGGKATAAARRLLNPLGRLVFYGMSDAMPGRKRSWLKAAWAKYRTPSIHPLSLVVPNQGIYGIHLLYLKEKEEMMGPALEEIYSGVVDGRWRSIMDRTFPLTRDGAVEAHTFLHDRKNLGKVVLEAPAGLPGRRQPYLNLPFRPSPPPS